jgi:hypothetical protein
MSKARDLANAGTALTTVSPTELGYLDGVTSAVQTQIDSKITGSSAIAPTIVDAKGDIIAATAADTVSKLTVGANATVLTADSAEATGLKWATPAAGGMTLLSTTTLSGSTVTVSSINQTYTNLLVVVHGITNAVATTDLICNFNIGNRTVGARYSSYSLTLENRAVNWDIGTLLRTNANNVFVFEVTNYASTTRYKGVKMFGYGFSSGSSDIYMNQMGALVSNTAVSSFTISNSGSRNFDSGEILVYGVK